MATLPESSTYTAGIYQLETSDPVLGGVNGVSNQQGKDLANRTKWLKDHLAALEGALTWTETTLYTSGTFTPPAGVSQVLILEAAAAGGGGAGAWEDDAGSGGTQGGGGGEGARVEMLTLDVTPEEEITVTLPAGGAGGATVKSDTYSATCLGTDGGDLVFGALLTLAGGKGGGIAGNVGLSSGEIHELMMGGRGGTTTINSLEQRGLPGETGGLMGSGGNGGGKGGGRGGNPRLSLAATAGVAGGGGGGGGKTSAGTNQAGAAGGHAFIRIGYWVVEFTGNT